MMYGPTGDADKGEYMTFDDSTISDCVCVVPVVEENEARFSFPTHLIFPCDMISEAI